LALAFEQLVQRLVWTLLAGYGQWVTVKAQALEQADREGSRLISTNAPVDTWWWQRRRPQSLRTQKR